jgi:hypothetical protein
MRPAFGVHAAIIGLPRGSRAWDWSAAERARRLHYKCNLRALEFGHLLVFFSGRYFPIFAFYYCNTHVS